MARTTRRPGGLAITVVFRPDPEARRLRIALVAFGRRSWLDAAADRRRLPG